MGAALFCNDKASAGSPDIVTEIYVELKKRLANRDATVKSEV